MVNGAGPEPKNCLACAAMNTPQSPGPSALSFTACVMAALPPLFWSGNFLIARIMHDQIPPIQMSLWRWTLALIILAPFGLRHLRTHAPRLRQELPFLIMLGGIGITAFNCFIYAALHHTTVVNAALINTLMPVFTFVLAAGILRETLSRRQAAGIALAVAGAAGIILRGGTGEFSLATLNRGDLLVVGGVIFWALYTVLIRWRRTGLPLNLFLTVTIFFGVVIHLPFVAWEVATVGGFTPTAQSLGAIVYFALFPSVAAYILWNRAVALLGPGRTGMFMYLMPAFSAALGVGFLDEAFRLYHAVGIALIFAGITLVTRRPKAAT